MHRILLVDWQNSSSDERLETVCTTCESFAAKKVMFLSCQVCKGVKPVGRKDGSRSYSCVN